MQVNEQNYREVLIRHLEGELSADERRAVESYLASHAEAAEEWRRLQRTRLQPDIKVAYPNKARLYRVEEKEEPVAAVRKLTPYPYLKYLSAIAAVVVFAAIYFVLRPQKAAEETGSIALQEPVKPAPEKTGPAAVPATGDKSGDRTFVQGQGGSGKTDPAPDKDKKKEEKKKTPKKTIIIVKDPVSMPEKDNRALVMAEPLKGFESREVAITGDNEYTEPEADYIAESSPAWGNTRVDAFAEQEDEYVNTFTRVYRFFTRNVSLRREVKEEEEVYAFRLQTKNVSIYKTFRGF